MNPDDFGAKKSGRLCVSTARIHARNVSVQCFVPDGLPSKLEIGSEIQEANDRALLALGELRGTIPALPNPELLTVPFMRREAVLSSRIEGTHTEIRGLFLFETEQQEGGTINEDDADAQEVFNYLKALKHGLEELKKLPVCIRIIKGMHEKLLSGVIDGRGRNKSPGEFRKGLVFIGNSEDILSARYVPPPGSEVPDLMGALETYINTEWTLPKLVTIAIIHYQFEAIHPFEDGNGRLGRLLIILLLISTKILPEPLLYLSAFFERNRGEYNDGMLRVSTNSEWKEWILFFLNGVESEARDASERARKLRVLREEYRQQMQKEVKGTHIIRLVDELFAWPAVTINRASRTLGLSFQGAKNNVEKLVEYGILEEVTGNYRNRVFMAKPILELIN